MTNNEDPGDHIHPKKFFIVHSHFPELKSKSGQQKPLLLRLESLGTG